MIDVDTFPAYPCRMSSTTEIRKARIAVKVAFLINGVTTGTFVSRIPDFKRTLNLTNSALGLSLIFISFGVLSAIKPAGLNAAKYGSKPMTLIGGVGIAVTLPFVSLHVSRSWFVFILFIYGFVNATQDVSMNSHAVTLEERAGRKMMSSFHAMWSVGALAGGAIGGLVAQAKIGTGTHFIAVSIVILIASFFIRNFFLPAESDRHQIAKEAKQRNPRIFWTMGLLGLCGAIGEGSAGDWGGVLSRDTFHASPFIATLPYIFFATTMVIGRFMGDRLSMKYGTRRLLITSGFIGGVGLASGLLIGHPYGVILGWFLLGLGVSTVIPLIFSAAGAIAIKDYQGQISSSGAVATVSGITYFGFVVGPPLMGFAADRITLRWAMLIPAALAIVLALGARQTIKE